MRIERGERVGLVGPSGSGKTTLLDVIAGRVALTSGQVMVRGTDLKDLSGRSLRQHRSKNGIISQHLDLVLPLRASTNVALGRIGQRRFARAVLELANSARNAELLGVLGDLGLGQKATEPTANLSGGERQRVAIARLLYQEPELVLADEPTSSQDPTRAGSVMDRICGNEKAHADGPNMKLTRGKVAPARTILVSAHAPDLLMERTDRMVGLRHGQVHFDLPTVSVTQDHLDALYADEPT